MKRLFFLVVSLYCAFGNIRTQAESGKGLPSQAVTLNGVLVDAYCYMKEGDLANTHGDMKNCGAECLKDGLPAGVLAEGKLYVLIFPGSVFKDYLYLPVEVVGERYGESDLIPVKVTVTVNGKKKKLKLAGKVMM